MSQTAFNRRHFLGSATSLGVMSGLVHPSLAHNKTLIRTYWWGTKDRSDRTYKVLDMFMAANPNINILGEMLGWQNYWTLLDDLTRSNTLPDLIQMDFDYVSHYAHNMNLLPLDEFVGKQIDLSGFAKQTINAGKIQGKLYGVSQGVNSTALIFDSETFTTLNIPQPNWPMTWDELGVIAAHITKATPKTNYWGMTDSGGLMPAFEVWLADRGMNIYDDEGRFSADATDMADWFGFWARMRDMKACLPPEEQSLNKQDISTDGLSLGTCALTFSHSNRLGGFQEVNKRKLDMAMYPTGASKTKSGQYLKPSMMWCIAANSKVPEPTARLLNYCVTSTDAGKVLGVDRGIPASETVRNTVKPTLDERDKISLDYISLISNKVREAPRPPPSWASAVPELLERMNGMVGFRKLSVADAARQFMRDLLI